MFKFIQKILFCLSLVIATSNAAPFQNGSFEQDSALWVEYNYLGSNGFSNVNPSAQRLTGWNIEEIIIAVPNYGGSSPNRGMQWYKSSTSAHAGEYYLKFYTADYEQETIYARLSQIFDTIIGKKYEVKFYRKNFTTSSPTSDTIWKIRDTDENGTLIHSVTKTPTITNAWQEDSFEFTATSNTTYLSFENGCACSSGNIDNITVTEIPYPNWQRYGALYPDDPTHANTKSVPGQDIVIDWSAVNTGDATSDAGTYKMTISIPIQMSFRIGSVVCEQGRRTLQYNEPGLTGLWQASENFTTIDMANTTMTLPCTSSDISYSSVGKNGPWGYIPSMDFSAGASWDGSGGTFWYDNDVRAVRIMPQGEFGHNNSVAPYPAFRVHLVAKIK